MGIDEVHLNFNQNNLWALNLCLAFIMFGVALDLKVEDFKRIALSPKKFGVGIFLFPFFYLLISLIIYSIWGAVRAFGWVVISFPSMLSYRK